MSRRYLAASLSVLALTAIVAGLSLVHAQGPMPQPSKEHQELAKDVGTWDADSKFWMAPDTPPITSKAVEVNKMLGSMWLISEYKGEIMGQDFVGHGQFGYDPFKKKYTGTWIDNINPGLSVMEGTMDEATKTLTLMSTGVNPMTGKEEISKMVSTYIDDDHKKFEAFGEVPDKKGEWWKMMEIDYTRRK